MNDNTEEVLETSEPEQAEPEVQLVDLVKAWQERFPGEPETIDLEQLSGLVYKDDLTDEEKLYASSLLVYSTLSELNRAAVQTVEVVGRAFIQKLGKQAVKSIPSKTAKEKVLKSSEDLQNALSDISFKNQTGIMNPISFLNNLNDDTIGNIVNKLLEETK